MRSSCLQPAGSSRIEPGTTPATDVVLSWPTFSDAAVQAGRSRRYGGIHFRDGDLVGQALGAMVGAGAVVTADVADHALVVGNPARQAGWACECGQTLPERLACGCGRSYRLSGAGTLEERSSAAGHDG